MLGLLAGSFLFVDAGRGRENTQNDWIAPPPPRTCRGRITVVDMEVVHGGLAAFPSTFAGKEERSRWKCPFNFYSHSQWGTFEL